MLRDHDTTFSEPLGQDSWDFKSQTNEVGKAP